MLVKRGVYRQQAKIVRRTEYVLSGEESDEIVIPTCEWAYIGLADKQGDNFEITIGGL